MIGSLDDLSRRPGMPSLWTLQRLVAHNPDFPVIERGGRGRRYRIDLAAAEQFIRDLKAARVVDAAERMRAIKEMGLTQLAAAAGGVEKENGDDR